MALSTSTHLEIAGNVQCFRWRAENGQCHPAVAATQITFFGNLRNFAVTLARRLLGPTDRPSGQPRLVGLIRGFARLALGAVLPLRQPARSGRGRIAELATMEALQ
jgi:hypothetical protein